MSTTPISDAINEQFDAWDAQIDELKKQASEAAKKQIEKLKKDIKDYVKKKKDELDKDKEKTTEKSSAAKAVQAIKDGIKSIDDAIDAINKILKFLGDSATYLISVAQDAMQAPITLANRFNQTLANLGSLPDEAMPIPELGELPEPYEPPVPTTEEVTGGEGS